MEKRDYQSKSGYSKRLRSFGFAFTGIKELVLSEPNAKLHLLATILAITAGVILKISLVEWSIVSIVIGLVWAAEGFNTVIEKLVDHLMPEYNETARIVKDISAGAVLMCALAAFACGCFIFIPKLYDLLIEPLIK
jgi:diacylglycerol kinase